MKVALISSLVHPDALGGVESYLLNVAPELGKKAEVVIVTGTRSKVGLFPGENGRDANRIRIVELRNLGLYPLWDYRRHGLPVRFLWHLVDFCNPGALESLRRVLKREGPDIVHTHNLRGISLVSFKSIASLGMPHVHTLHDYLLLSPLANLSFADMVLPPNMISNRLYQLYTRSLTRRTNAVIGPSRSVLATHESRGFFRESTRFVLPNPMPKRVSGAAGLRGFSKERIDQPELSLLFVGALERFKGVPFLLKAINATKIENVRFHIVGRGSLEGTVAEHAKRDRRILFHGYVTQAELARLYGLCDALLFVSQWPEPLPMVILEALSYNLPVIATSVGGVSEIISDQNGWLISSKSYRQLANTIDMIARDRTTLEHKRLTPPSYATLPSIEDHVRALLRVYGQCRG